MRYIYWNIFLFLRLDISDDYVVITKELLKKLQHYVLTKGLIYDSYIDEVRLHERQAKSNSRWFYWVFTKRKFWWECFEKFIKDINLLDDNEINTLDLAKITTSIKNPVNPYAK